MRAAFILLITFLLTGPAWSQTVPDTGAIYQPQIRELVREFVRPLVRSRPSQERAILKQVKIMVTPEATNFKRAETFAGASREVFISDGFIHGIHSYAEAFAVEKFLGLQHFRERYFSYLFWRRPPIYSGPAPKSPKKWAGFNTSREKKFRQQGFADLVPQLIAAALVDVLLHELGHHAKDALYNPQTTSKAQSKRMERAADAWASQASYDYTGDRSPLGRFISVGYIFELERWRGLSPFSSHPLHSARIGESVSGRCDGSNDERIAKACRLLRSEVKAHFSAKGTEAEYRKRANAGEGFAHFKLGLLLIARGAPEEACKHLDAGFEKSKMPRALVYLGWCYDKGHIAVSDAKVAKILARVHYKSAAKQGFRDAKQWLKNNPE